LLRLRGHGLTETNSLRRLAVVLMAVLGGHGLAVILPLLGGGGLRLAVVLLLGGRLRLAVVLLLGGLLVLVLAGSPSLGSGGLA
jgi:hypothetical protein